jgi:putative oxidoreductase
MNALIYRGNQVAGWLSRHSVDILRVNLGLTFLGFGVLKFFPGASPAEALVMRTIDTLTLSIVSGRSAVLLTALMECFFGLTLVTNKLRTGLLVLGLSLVGIMSPPVLFFGDLFPGTPTLEPQRPRGFCDGVRVSGGDTPGGRVRDAWPGTVRWSRNGRFECCSAMQHRSGSRLVRMIGPGSWPGYTGTAWWSLRSRRLRATKACVAPSYFASSDLCEFGSCGHLRLPTRGDDWVTAGRPRGSAWVLSESCAAK